MNVDILLKNAEYLDCVDRCFKKGDIAIKDGIIIDIGKFYEANTIIDCSDKYIVPGFIDSHIHLESSIISPDEFLKKVILHGTTSLITDPHEIANVCGSDGIKYILEKTKNMPVETYVMIPSCVPATNFDIINECIDSSKTKIIFDELLKKYPGRILGLAEMMNYPGVINGDKDVLEKINYTLNYGLKIDGHAPGLKGNDFLKYILRGISSDHECTSYEEAKEKLDIAIKNNLDFNIAIREGTAAKNAKELSKLFNHDEYKERLMFCTDDKHPNEFFDEGNGHIDYIIKKCINEYNVNSIDAYIAASYNAAKHYNLDKKGLIQNGNEADILIISDLENVQIDTVIKRGTIITEKYVSNIKNNPIGKYLSDKINSAINLNKVSTKDIATINNQFYQVIGIIPGEIVTTDEGVIKGSDSKKELVKSIVFESHTGTNKFSTVFLKHFDLSKGAIGITVAHDSHYLVVAGTTDEDISLAVNSLIDMQGGMIYVDNNKIVEKVELPIANLMTDEDPKLVVQKINNLKSKVLTKDGIDPFMNLSFLSLAVIGNIKNLPSGPFDVINWKLLDENDLKDKYEAKDEK